jgi:hypothetical protein
MPEPIRGQGRNYFPVIGLGLLTGERAEMAALQRVLEGAPRYAERITGAPPGPADAQSTYTVLPEGKGYEDKFVYGVYAGGEMIGCADVIRGWPRPDTAHIGLLLIGARHQRGGYGRAAYRRSSAQSRPGARSACASASSGRTRTCCPSGASSAACRPAR